MTWIKAHTDKLSRLSTALLTAAVVLGQGKPASAQDELDKASAEALFTEGRQLLDEGNLPEACPKLIESMILDPSISTMLNVALCHEKSGRIASAWSLYKQAEEQAAQANRVDLKVIAARRAASLEPRLARLIVVLDEPVRGLSLKRDEITIEASFLGVAMPIDSGEHVITANAPGKKTYRAAISIEDGERAVVHIPALEPGEPDIEPKHPSAPPVSQEPALARPAPERGRTQRALGLAIGGGGVAVLGLSGVFALIGRDRYNTSLEHCREKNLCDSEGVSRRDDARLAGNVATVTGAIGLVALAGGVTLWLTAPPSSPQNTTGILIAPTLGGAVVQGAF